MNDIRNYMQDGANFQERAVLAALQGNVGDGIECSWNEFTLRYDANIRIARWENCREQGYVCWLASHCKQLNIAWFECRNSDEICKEVEQEEIHRQAIEDENENWDNWNESEGDINESE